MTNRVGRVARVFTVAGVLALTILGSHAIAAPIEGTPPPAMGEATAASAPAITTETQQDLFLTTLQKMIGKHVTVHLMAGRELTGLVSKVTEDAVHLSELGGRDFFDAIVRMEHISAIIYRVKKEP
jgi:sRNA-binding regulator protein Hfq